MKNTIPKRVPWHYENCHHIKNANEKSNETCNSKNIPVNLWINKGQNSDNHWRGGTEHHTKRRRK